MTRYVGWNLARLVTRRWKRYGRAAVVVGAPIPLGPWFAAQLRPVHRRAPERLARVQALCDGLLERVGALIPVTSVPLVCAAIQSFDGDFVPRDALLERIDEMRGVLSRAECGRDATGPQRRGAVRSRVAHAAHATRDRAKGAAISCCHVGVHSSATTRTVCASARAVCGRRSARDALPALARMRRFDQLSAPAARIVSGTSKGAQRLESLARSGWAIEHAALPTVALTARPSDVDGSGCRDLAARAARRDSS